MLSNGYINCEFDSGNRLLKAGVNEYVYNAEDVRIKNLCQGDVTTYTYNTNCKLSQLLQKTTNGITTKYVYGLGLIGEDKLGVFKTYHFDYRGSTVAITDIYGNITDTFKYDTYGRLLSRTGDSFVIFGYNGRDGVVTDKNGLIYMRARYYSPELRRFINADIIHGEISDSTSLNRYAYVNGNPVSFVDPFGLSADDRGNFHTAVYIANIDDSEGGLKYVGHTELYFLNDKGEWYYTEYDVGNVGSDASKKAKKSSAKVYYEKVKKLPFTYDPETGKLTPHINMNYVVLTGDFNASVNLAEEYDNNQRTFGGYNFLFNNCSHYTDEILDKAKIDGFFTKMFALGDPLISIPVIQEFRASAYQNSDVAIEYIWTNIESGFNSVVDGMRDFGKEVSKTAKKFWKGIKSWF